MYAFTLIELLIVIALMGILSAIGIPSYQHYLERARFSEVMMATAPYKTGVTLALQDGVPIKEISDGEYHLPIPANSTKNLENIEVKKGTIIATATKKAGGYTYILTPDNTGTQWEISGSCLKAGLCHD